MHCCSPENLPAVMFVTAQFLIPYKLFLQLSPSSLIRLTDWDCNTTGSRVRNCDSFGVCLRTRYWGRSGRGEDEAYLLPLPQELGLEYRDVQTMRGRGVQDNVPIRGRLKILRTGYYGGSIVTCVACWQSRR